MSLTQLHKEKMLERTTKNARQRKKAEWCGFIIVVWLRKCWLLNYRWSRGAHNCNIAAPSKSLLPPQLGRLRFNVSALERGPKACTFSRAKSGSVRLAPVPTGLQPRSLGHPTPVRQICQMTLQPSGKFSTFNFYAKSTWDARLAQ